MNIYWSKVKLRAVANQAIYLVILDWVVNFWNFISTLLILPLVLYVEAFKRGVVISLAICQYICFFLN